MGEGDWAAEAVWYDALTSALKAGGWSLAEFATDLGHAAEARTGYRDDPPGRAPV